MANEKRLVYDADFKLRLKAVIENRKRMGLPYEQLEDVAFELLAICPTVDAVVLPCKVGDTVWIPGDKFPAEIERIIIDVDGISFEYVEYDRGWEETEVWNDGVFQTTDIGETVFLTPEEAGAALAKMYGGNEDD